MDLISEKVIRSIVDVDGYITANSLADLTGISASNIKHNLSQIKKELEKFHASLQSIPKKGFLLVATPEQRQEIIHALNEAVSRTSEFYTYRKEYILETLFLYPANYTIQLFSDELSVSRNTIQKDLEQIDKELKKFHVEIRRVRNQGIILEGNEFNIRQSMIDCNNSKYWNWNRDTILEDTGPMDRRISKKAYTYLSNTYSKEDLIAAQEELQAGEIKLGIQFIDISFGRLLEYLAITMERVRLGKKINKEEQKGQPVKIPDKYLEAALHILKHVLPEMKKGYLPEAQYLAARLFVASTCDDANIEADDEYKDIVIDFLLRIEEIIGTKLLSVNAELIKELSIAFVRIKIREAYQILDWSELYRDIQKQLTGLYGICITNIHSVEECIGCRFRQDDVAWITLLIRNCIHDIKNRIPAILVHGTNYHTAFYQKEKIEEEIPKLIIKKSLYFKNFEPAMAENCLVISTVPFKDYADNVIEITKHINKNDLECIKNGLDNMEWRYQTKLIQELIHEVFETQLIMPDLSVPHKEEAISQMTELLLKNGCVEEGFLEDVLERERFCPTSIGNEIAIPHGYYDNILKNAIAVARVRHRVCWNQDEKVKLIFLIAIKYKEPLKIKVLFHYLYELIENQELLKKIKNADTSTQIYDYITKGKA
ncbi:MAG: HTH domain-containing protein [Lachnospiraceae bacterium]|nr:HTH domain-containing protein [Lachnospiraceae bacterium]